MRNFLRNTAPLRRAYYRYRLLRAAGQSNETEILDRLSVGSPRTFIEFGFHPIEFNCISLARNPEWCGLLVDGDARQVSDAELLFRPNVTAVQRFLTLDNLDFIKTHFAKIGVLSIDVDGNDYWFLRALLPASPDIVAVEYNSTFGDRPISVLYDPMFDRHQKHDRGWYHGASLAALTRLCSQFGYGLAAVSEGGTNAFFTRGGHLDPSLAWRPNRFRERFSGVPHKDQWQAVQHLPYVTV